MGFTLEPTPAAARRECHAQLLRPGEGTRTRARGSRPLQVACTAHALAVGRLAAVGRTPTPGSICGCCRSRAALAERGCAREDGLLAVLNASHAAVAPGMHRQFTRQTLRFSFLNCVFTFSFLLERLSGTTWTQTYLQPKPGCLEWAEKTKAAPGRKRACTEHLPAPGPTSPLCRRTRPGEPVCATRVPPGRCVPAGTRPSFPGRRGSPRFPGERGRWQPVSQATLYPHWGWGGGPTSSTNRLSDGMNLGVNPRELRRQTHDVPVGQPPRPQSVAPRCVCARRGCAAGFTLTFHTLYPPVSRLISIMGCLPLPRICLDGQTSRGAGPSLCGSTKLK